MNKSGSKVHKTHFYSHLVRFESLHIELEKLDLSNEQREHLVELASSTTHHAIIDDLLTELSHEDKTHFLLLLDENDHGKIWNHLREKIVGVEKRIQETAGKLIQQFHQDITEVVQQHN